MYHDRTEIPKLNFHGRNYALDFFRTCCYLEMGLLSLHQSMHLNNNIPFFLYITLRGVGVKGCTWAPPMLQLAMLVHKDKLRFLEYAGSAQAIHCVY